MHPVLHVIFKIEECKRTGGVLAKRKKNQKNDKLQHLRKSLWELNLLIMQCCEKFQKILLLQRYLEANHLPLKNVNKTKLA